MNRISIQILIRLLIIIFDQVNVALFIDHMGNRKFSLMGYAAIAGIKLNYIYKFMFVKQKNMQNNKYTI